MAIASPPELTTNPFKRIRGDWQVELAGRRRNLPPGGRFPSVIRTERMRRDPLAVLLPAYEEHGPIFALRIFHSLIVFMIGPEANRFILVTDREKFRWRDGSLGGLLPLIGDGLLTTDGAYHDRARELVVPAFHRERIAAAASTMSAEADAGLREWRQRARVDLYDWTRHVAMRVAMQSLFGLDPERSGVDVAATFERGLSFYEREYWLQVVRGPGSPFARLRGVRRVLDRIILDEIARRRRSGAGEDILSVLLEATDSEGVGLSDEQIRDQVLTLLFAGHDTTTSTVAFLFYELARHPEWAERIAAESERVAPDRAPTAAELFAELHRDALRGARGARDRGRDPAPVPARARAWLVTPGAPDAHALAARRPADAGARGLTGRREFRLPEPPLAPAPEPSRSAGRAPRAGRGSARSRPPCGSGRCRSRGWSRRAARRCRRRGHAIRGARSRGRSSSVASRSRCS